MDEVEIEGEDDDEEATTEVDPVLDVCEISCVEELL
jgi:hypothetical protein